MAYDNRGRQQAARSTRARVLEAAQASFLDRGFGGTTIRQVADVAGVSQETVYKAFGGKAALLKAVYDVALAGDDNDVPLAGRPEISAVREARNPDDAAAAYARLAQVISSRTDPLLRIVLAVRGSDPVLEGFARTIEEERRVGCSFVVGHWADAGWLREDLTRERATDAVWALIAPYERWLLLDHGWTDDEYTEWLYGLLRRVVLTDAGSAT